MNTRYMKMAVMAGALMMALPLGATAADSTYSSTQQQAREDAREIRQDASQKAREVRNDAADKMRDVRDDARDKMRDTRNDMRNATEEQRNEATMERLNAKEDNQTVGEYLDDAGVTAKVKSKFVGQKGLDSLDIKVVTVNGGVTLMGDVDNAAQVGLAESVAKEVDGVKSVDNKLVVKP